MFTLAPIGRLKLFEPGTAGCKNRSDSLSNHQLLFCLPFHFYQMDGEINLKDLEKIAFSRPVDAKSIGYKLPINNVKPAKSFNNAWKN